jgi:protein O-mannosyl-transferase
MKPAGGVLKSQLRPFRWGHLHRSVPWRYLAVAAVALATYWQITRIGFLSDDHLFLALAPSRPVGLSLLEVPPWGLFYRPLGLLVWSILYRLFGSEPTVFHLTSAALHAMNCVLVVAFVRQLTCGRHSLALTTGLLYAVLPLSIEAIAWASALFDLLATTTYLLTLLALMRAWQAGRWWHWVLALLVYQLCLWSKETAFTLPALVLVLALTLARRPAARAVALSVALLTLLLIVNLWQRYAAWGDFGGYDSTNYLPRPQLLLNSASIVLGLLAPYNQALFGVVRVGLTVAFMASIMMVGLLAAWQRRTVWFGLAWLAVTSAASINISGIGPDLQDTRYLYLPAVGYCLVLAEVLRLAVERLAGGQRGLARVAALALIGYYFVLVQVQIQPWINATQISDGIAAEIDQLTAGARPGTRLQAINLPDNFRGAFIYRNGLEARQWYRYGSLFYWERVGKTWLPLFSQEPADLYQIEFGYASETETYKAVAARAVQWTTEVQPAMPEEYFLTRLPRNVWPAAQVTMNARRPEPVQTWALADCDPAILAEWAAAQSCVPDRGVALNHGWLKNTSVQRERSEWVSVVISLELPAKGEAGSILQLQWAMPDGTSDMQAIELPREPFAGRLLFFLPPAAGEVAGFTLSVAGPDRSLLISAIDLVALPPSPREGLQ